MGLWQNIITNLPEVASPTQKKLSFKEKLKWTMLILVIFYILGLMPLFGLGRNSLEQFEFLSIILAADFGSLISLGIGPIVTASIVLQLLNGSGLIKFDLTTSEGKRNFQGTQKILAVFFILFEAAIYVFMGGLSTGDYYSPSTGAFTIEAAAGTIALSAGTILALKLGLVFQLFLGGLLILFMDEVVSKWGFGSGVSLFIAAGVSEEIIVRTISWIPSPANPEIATGAIPALIQSLSIGDPTTATFMVAGILSTAFIFAISVYAQSMKVEIPLSFGRIRGHGIRWPLSFMYTSNIPVILIAALLANVQLWARLFQNWAVSAGNRFLDFISIRILGQIDTVNSGHGIIQWVNPPNIVGSLIKGGFTFPELKIALGYIALMVGGSIIFSMFWVQTAGMDAKSQAKQMMSSGLQIPGFRRDERVLERLLNRYIWPLTIMGGAAVGLLASLADLTGALSRGTGILLTVMIVYRLYEEISKQHMMDMNPMLRKFIKV